jgi:glutamyl-tRNA reductase
MSILVIGINHKTATVSIREKVAFSPESLREALHSARQFAKENLILSTCNRTEIYVADKSELSADKLTVWLANFHSITVDQLSPYIYHYSDEKAVQHLLRVACGLDSLVLGEPQILGQLKDALQYASAEKTIGNQFNRLHQHVFSAAKKVRTQTNIGANPVSVAYAAVNLSKQIFSRLEKQTALLVGAGETIELVGRHLNNQHIGNIIVANRSVDKAQRLAEEYGEHASAIPLTELHDNLYRADIVITSTAAPIPIIGKGMVENALKQRKYRSIFMVDIAVPRDVEAEVSQLDDVYLYTVDDLQDVIKENMKSREQAAERAEIMVQAEAQVFMHWLHAKDQMRLIQSYRHDAYQTKQEVLDKALRRLKNGESAEDALQFLAHTLTNKLLHTPSTTINKAAYDGDEELISAAKKLLNIQDIT